MKNELLSEWIIKQAACMRMLKKKMREKRSLVMFEPFNCCVPANILAHLVQCVCTMCKRQIITEIAYKLEWSHYAA